MRLSSARDPQLQMTWIPIPFRRPPRQVGQFRIPPLKGGQLGLREVLGRGDLLVGSLKAAIIRGKPTPWQALRPTEQQKQQISECWYCHRLGHTRATCRKLLGQCLACGARDHFLAACPMREGTAKVAERRSARGRQTGPHVSFSMDEEGGTTEHNGPGNSVGNW